MIQDDYSANGFYYVKSLYFDTIDFDDYYDKVEGLKDRRKIRLRIYNSNYDNVKLEMKSKYGDVQRKISVLVDRNISNKICIGDYMALLDVDEDFSYVFYLLLQERVPSTIITYKRCALTFPTYDVRITFDYDIYSQRYNLDLYNDDLGVPVFDNGVILEVKYNEYLPDIIRIILQSESLLRESYSKYCFGLVY